MSNIKLIDPVYTDFSAGRVFSGFIVNILMHLLRKNLNVFILMLADRPQGHRIEIGTIGARS